MTENKLTLQDCFKYPEAKIVRFDLVLGVKIDTFYSIQDFIEESARYALISDIEILNYKLILRDTTQLTDEQKQYINDNYIDKLFKNTFDVDNIIWNDYTEIMSVCNNKLELIDYLRRINIDIDGFLQSGKAVKG